MDLCVTQKMHPHSPQGTKMALFPQCLKTAVLLLLLLFFLRDTVIKGIRNSGKQVVSESPSQ